MVVGFNHNIRYQGEMFHIQTEDGGIKSPYIVTLLYRGGTIISSKKTGYADIIKIENLDKVVEELMKDQHKEMLRRLKAGEFDDRAFPGGRTPVPPEEPKAAPQPAAPPPESTPPEPVAPAPVHKQSLDEIILDYLVIGDE